MKQIGNMEQFQQNSERTQSPTDEDDEEDDENHEQIRLVETPDPLVFSRMDSSNGKSVDSITGAFRDTSPNALRKDFTTIQCQNEFYSNYICPKEESSMTDMWPRIWKKCRSKKCSPLDWIVSVIPILSWLPKYKWKADLAFDATAGFTVAVMNIPQGMAYALLSNVEPIVGLYMGFFPVIMYTILGTSRHVSIGTFAVICLMSGKVVSEKAAYFAEKSANTTNDSSIVIPNYSTTEISTALSLCVGVWQLIMGIFQLGSLSVLLSAELISGFTTGCAIHVLTSQMKNLFGLHSERRTGLFKIPLTYIDIAFGITKEANTTAILLSLVTVTFLVTYNELIKPTIYKRLSFPIPIELITIIIGTLVSRYWITSSAYGISVVNKIPTGLPDAVVPPLKIVPDLILDGLIIAVVAYAISISMAKIFAHKHQYEVRPNQELIANGSSNVFGSFFSCAPIAASLSRSLIQEQVGGKTQLAGLFSCTIILFVLLWLAPFFETLPHCVLSSLIVVALKGMFLQFSDFPQAWKQSRINGGIWMVSFLATVFLDIEYGLVIGVIITISSLLWKSSSFDVIEMGQHVHSHLFVEKNKPDTAVAEVPHIKILKLVGNLNFVTKDVFVSKVESILNRNKLYLQRKSSGKISTSGFYTSACNLKSTISALVLDFSSVSSIDPASVKAIRELYDNQEKVGVQIFYVACPNNIIGVMKQCNLFKDIKLQYFFPSIEHVIMHLDLESMGKGDHSQHTDTNVLQNGDHFNEYFLGQ